MKLVSSFFIALAIAGAAQAQTAAPATATSSQTPPAANLTRDLNSGPPRPAGYIAPAPAPPPASPAPGVPRPVQPPVAAVRTVAPIPTTPAPTPTTPAPAPATAPVGPASPATPPRTQALAVPASSPAAASAPAPAVARPVPAVPVATATPAPTATPSAEAPPPAAPAYTMLDATARAALPFTMELPAGFSITTGRPGPDFRIYTIRRGDRSFAMVYAGPASQFPIYGGQTVQAGGRATVISSEGGQRHAMEHLFQRTDEPREIHVWTMSLEGADRLLAERIAQSLEAR